MSTLFRSCLAVVLALCVGGLVAGPAAAQSTHGEISTVSGETIYVRLNDSLSVEPGSEGLVVEERTVGGETVQVSFAVVTVREVERTLDGVWQALCDVKRRSEDLEVNDPVQFEEVFPRSTLSIETIPANSIAYLDSINLGTTPVRVPVGTGPHTVRVEQNGYYPESTSIIIGRGESRTLRDTLQTARGTLTINTLPDGATVAVNGNDLGQAPVSKTLQTGTYEIEARSDGYLPLRRSVKVPADEETRLNLTLQRPLKVEVAPDQPDVIVNPNLTRKGDRLIFEYDLVGEADAYSVELLLSTNGGKTFDPLPETVAGAVGNEVAPGRKKQLVWSATKDFPKGLPESGNQLRLAVEEGGSNRLYWLVGSALAAGASGAVATVLGVFGGSGGGGGGGGGGGDLPTSPPSPPMN